MSGAEPGWDRLARALGILAEATGAPVPFWLRDDDAVAPSAALSRLLDLAGEAGVPVCLAVIPGKAEPALAAHLAERPEVAVLQHGFSHRDHAPPGEKAAEFGAHRALDVMRAEIAEGRRRLAGFAGFVPIFVPPWNRIAPALEPDLPGLGLAGLSAFAGRRARAPVAGLARLDTHVDPVAWHAGRGLLPPAEVVAALASEVERRAATPAAPAAPIGILTHHLVHDAETFAFVVKLLHVLGRTGLTRWLSGAMLLEEFGSGQKMEAQ